MSATLLVNAIASVIGGQVGLGEGDAAPDGVAAGSGWVLVGVAALAALNCSSAPAIPPRVIPTIVAETLVIFIVDRATRHRHELVRNPTPARSCVTYGDH